MYLLAKYGTQTSFRFPLIKRGVVDLAASADWTPATGDCKISKDGASVVNTTNNPTVVGGVGSVVWTITLTAAELTAAEVSLQIVDAATKTIEDQFLAIYTYGHVSAKIVPDLSVADLAANVTQISGDATAADNLESYVDGTAFMPVDAHAPNFDVTGTTLTVKAPDGTTTAYTKTITTDVNAEPITGAS